MAPVPPTFGSYHTSARLHLAGSRPRTVFKSHLRMPLLSRHRILIAPQHASTLLCLLPGTSVLNTPRHASTLLCLRLDTMLLSHLGSLHLLYLVPHRVLNTPQRTATLPFLHRDIVLSSHLSTPPPCCFSVPTPCSGEPIVRTEHRRPQPLPPPPLLTTCDVCCLASCA